MPAHHTPRAIATVVILAPPLYVTNSLPVPITISVSEEVKPAAAAAKKDDSNSDSVSDSDSGSDEKEGAKPGLGSGLGSGHAAAAFAPSAPSLEHDPGGESPAGGRAGAHPRPLVSSI